jgi:hypothetical protein
MLAHRALLHECCSTQDCTNPLSTRYTLHPSGMGEFLKLAADTAGLRSQLLPFLG